MGWRLLGWRGWRRSCRQIVESALSAGDRWHSEPIKHRTTSPERIFFLCKPIDWDQTYLPPRPLHWSQTISPMPEQVTQWILPVPPQGTQPRPPVSLLPPHWPQVYSPRRQADLGHGIQPVAWQELHGWNCMGSHRFRVIAARKILGLKDPWLERSWASKVSSTRRVSRERTRRRGRRSRA